MLIDTSHVCHWPPPTSSQARSIHQHSGSQGGSVEKLSHVHTMTIQLLHWSHGYQ